MSYKDALIAFRAAADEHDRLMCIAGRTRAVAQKAQLALINATHYATMTDLAAVKAEKAVAVAEKAAVEAGALASRIHEASRRSWFSCVRRPCARKSK